MVKINKKTICFSINLMGHAVGAGKCFTGVGGYNKSIHYFPSSIRNSFLRVTHCSQNIKPNYRRQQITILTLPQFCIRMTTLIYNVISGKFDEINLKIMDPSTLMSFSGGLTVMGVIATGVTLYKLGGFCYSRLQPKLPEKDSIDLLSELEERDFGPLVRKLETDLIELKKLVVRLHETPREAAKINSEKVFTDTEAIMDYWEANLHEITLFLHCEDLSDQPSSSNKFKMLMKTVSNCPYLTEEDKNYLQEITPIDRNEALQIIKEKISSTITKPKEEFLTQLFVLMSENIQFGYIKAREYSTVFNSLANIKAEDKAWLHNVIGGLVSRGELKEVIGTRVQAALVSGTPLPSDIVLHIPSTLMGLPITPVPSNLWEKIGRNYGNIFNQTNGFNFLQNLKENRINELLDAFTKGI